MPQTVIDQLIVKLGLDPRDFTKGTKEAAAAVVNTEQTVEKSSAGMGRQLTAVAGKWLTVAGAILAVKKAVTVIDDVAARTRRLGIDAKNYNTAAAELRNFENAVEIVGGNAEDARKTVAGFTRAIFDLAYNGQMSDSLVMLARLGVQFQTATGEARDFESVVLDTADAIGKAQEQGMSRANAFQYLQQAGFDQGTAQLILEGRGKAEAELNAQRQRRQVSGQDLTQATEINRARIGRDQAIEGAKITGMEFAGDAQQSFNEFLEKLASPGGVNNALEELSSSADKLKGKFLEFVSGYKPKGRAVYEDTIQRAAARNNIPPEILAGVLATESGFDPAAVNAKSGAKGIAQLMPQYYPKAGRDPHDDIRTAAAELAKYEKQAGGDWDMALRMYNAGPGRVRDSMKPGGKPLAQETIDYPEKVYAYASGNTAPAIGANAAAPSPTAQARGAGNYTKVDIDQITVNTQATDAEGVAGEIDASVKRKLLASHAEQGMQ